jgi:hypothetical protein
MGYLDGSIMLKVCRVGDGLQAGKLIPVVDAVPEAP